MTGRGACVSYQRATTYNADISKNQEWRVSGEVLAGSVQLKSHRFWSTVLWRKQGRSVGTMKGIVMRWDSGKRKGVRNRERKRCWLGLAGQLGTPEGTRRQKQKWSKSTCPASLDNRVTIKIVNIIKTEALKKNKLQTNTVNPWANGVELNWGPEAHIQNGSSQTCSTCFQRRPSQPDFGLDFRCCDLN